MTRLRNATVLGALLVLGLSAQATAGTVKVRVIGPASTYEVLLFHTGDALPSGRIVGGLPYGGWRDFSFTGAPNGRRYFIRVTRGDGFTRQTNDGYLNPWWPWLGLGELNMYGLNKPDTQEPQAVQNKTWSQVKGLYH